MDNNASVLQVQRGNRSFAGFRYLTRLTENTVSAQRLKWIWDQMQDCENVFDDFTRGNVDFFLAQFANTDNEFYTVGNSALVVINQAIEGGSADIHYVVWDHSLDLHKQRQPAAELFDYLFYQRKVHHVVGFIPSNNQRAIRFAQSVGMKFEGEIRENFKYEGRYYATHIYGVLEREYENFRARLV